MGRKASPNKNDFSTQLEEQVKNIALLKKEIQIEAALEKVRARTMAMQKTEELPQIINILFQQLQELSFDIYACSLALINERMSQEMWIAGYSKDILPQSYEIQYIDHIYFTHFIDIWQKGISYDVLSFEGKKKKEYDKYLFYETGMSTLPEEAKAEIMKIEKTFICAAYMKYGWIEINAEEGLPADQANILQRFAKVFEQTYTRFLDLQKAEAQAREAEIQLALERVRARTMAMHRSEELGEVAILLYKEFNALKMGDFFNCGFVIVNEADSVQNGWMTQPEGDFIEELDLPYPGDSIFKERLNAWSEGTGVFCQKVAGEKLAEHIKYVSDRSISNNQLSTILPYMPDPCYFYCGNFKEGYLHIVAKEELVPEAEAILARFTKVFSQTYTRFLDLQKAEAQAREARIETALEKIRSNMMAMHQSDELRQVVATMYDQLQNLGFDSSASMINIYNDDLSAEQWMAGFSHGELPKSYHIPYCDHPYFTEEVSGWQDGLPFHELIFEGPQKVEYAKWMIEHSDYKFLPAEFHQEMLSPERIYISNAHMKYGLVEVLGTEPLPEKSITTLIRFAKVFEQTYTRFLDLQKAEEQARESQIEASMERVRARAMAMHTTGELNELVALIYDEIQKLGLFDYGCSIIICDEANKVLQFWYAEINQLQSFRCYNVPINSQPVVQEQYQSWKKGLTQFDIEIRGKEHKEYIEFLLTETDHKKLPEEVKEGWRSFSEVFFTYSNFKYGLLEFVDVKPIDKNNYPIYQRFAKVFEQTYTRFLDLQKAEAQAREAEIQLALERVRARAMAMHQSQELAEVVALMYGQIQSLGFTDWGCAIIICDEEAQVMYYWYADINMSDLPDYFKVPLTNKTIKKTWELWKQGTPQFIIELHDEKMAEYADFMLEETDHKNLPQEVKDGWRSEKNVYFSYSNIKYGLLEFTEVVPFKEENLIIYQRFAHVFEQTYTRFLDLQRAEAQTREAKIEASLERVRGASMAMHKSEDLIHVANVMNQELQKLGFANALQASFILIDEEKEVQYLWGAQTDSQLVEYWTLPLLGDDVLQERYDAWKRKEPVLSVTLTGEKRIRHLEVAMPLENINEKKRQARAVIPDPFIICCGFFKYGYLCIISTEVLDEGQQIILARMAKVFEQTYTRFLDLQRAEEQVREAKIETALERVRARTMAMHHSDELIEVVKTLSLQILELKPDMVGNWLSLVDIESNSMKIIGSNGDLVNEYIVHGSDRVSYQHDIDAYKKGVPHWQFSLPKEVILEIWRETLDFEEMSLVPEGVTTYHLLHIRHAFGFFGFGSWEKADEETIVILSRFAKVFEQTYTRFLDLQKAEAQAREAGIELALERVRAKTMAMQQSLDLAEVVYVLYQQVSALNLADLACNINLFNKKNGTVESWVSGPDHDPVPRGFLLQVEHTYISQMWESWEKQGPPFSIFSTGEDHKTYKDFLLENWYQNMPEEFKQYIRNNEEAYFHFFNMDCGQIQAISSSELSSDKVATLQRFAAVFQQTYRRFLDLQRAESQVREAEIETALERIRSRTMGMQKSDELSDVAALLFKQIKILGAELWTISIAFCKEDELIVKKWGGSPITDQIFAPNFIPYNADHGEQSMYNTWKNKVELYSYVQEGKELKDIYDHLMTIPGFKANFQKVIDAGRPLPVWQKNHVASFKYGYLLVITEEEFKEEYVFTRFAKVFEQTYTRFLDLQKAETQTREAQIEASMERIRSRSLAMRTSDEIKDVMVEIRRQIDSLGQLDLEASVVHLYEKGNPMFESIAAVRPPGESGNIVLANVFFPVDGTDRIKDMMDYYWSDTKEYTLEFDKKMAEEWQQVMLTYAPMIAERRVGFVENRRISDYAEYWNFADFSEGSLLLVTHSPASEDTKTVLRKASQVFDLAYRRYRDLQKAEARAKEAIRQASLDRVRGEIASMRSTEDLNRITPLIWNELTALGVSFIRCGVFIIDEKSEIVDIYLSSPDGKSLGVMKLPFNSNDLTANTVKAWKKDCVYHQFWSRDAFISWTNSLVSQGFISDKEKYQGNQEAPAALNLNFIPFTQGMLYVGTAEELPNSKVELVKSLAKAFALAYSRYEDFVKLEMAKSEIESTLSELKATQAQLIQSEKMASLGELTAGIAHEIQNPLNFVNNFSEVSSEMIDEMKEELAKGDIKEAEAISDDLKENLEKIHHHGNRASSIVKGMLEHSRTSSGKKELTDINALADEYLRLAYHGLRAKEKDFNAEMVTHFDPKLPKIEVIPQDIGRVFLNLINNAFQAVQEEGVRKKEHGDLNYQPKVSITTQLITNNQLQITITDNGPGIPDEIKDKIFQPFFTTKDTGQGTGLGLSLAYDIVKAHGGELTVQSTISSGSEFTIVMPLNSK